MAISPDDPDEPPFIAQASRNRIVATRRHLARWLPKSAGERTTGAYPPRRVKEHDGLRAFEPKVKGLVIVAVGDPGVACEQGALPFPPLVVRWLHPARLPVVEVQVDHR